MATGPSAGNFKISDAPLASSPVRHEREPIDSAELPSHYGNPLLLAIARNPRTLFVCWNVNWPAAFGSDVPADRKAHVRLKCGDSERTYAVEPLSGSSSITDLEPGQIYAVEIGYYAPADRWNVIASAEEVMMPLEGRAAHEDAPVDVANVPFHLSFQRLIQLFGEEASHHIVQTLARFEKRAAEHPARNERKFLQALDLSLDDLETAAVIRQTLAKMRTRAQSSTAFGGSSLLFP